MKTIRTKELIAQHLTTQTGLFQSGKLSPFTTQEISRFLNLSRTVTSQYLNELCKEGTLIKVSSRPVYFFAKKALEKKYDIEIKETDFLNTAHLFSILNQNELLQKDFVKVIGYDSSLQDSITQMKSALLYPPNGLPMILHGEKGNGKTYLVQQIYEYCLNHNLIKKNGKLVTVTVLKNHSSSFLVRLFGDENTEGWIEKSDHGILYIKDATFMSVECQEKLSEFIAKGAYQKGKEEKKASVRIVLAARENPYEHFVQSLLLNIPVICKIPSLNERTREEREAFIIKFFLKEKQKINRTIYISKRLFDELIQHTFKNHINELQKCITGLCANAYMRSSSAEALEVYLYDLPAEMLSEIAIEQKYDGVEELLNIDDYKKSGVSSKIIALFDQILDSYLEYQNHHQAFSKFCDEGYQYMRQYYDFIVYEENTAGSKIRALEKLIDEILQIAKNNRQINLPLNCSFILARIIHSVRMNNSSMHSWEISRKADISNCLEALTRQMPQAYILSTHIAKHINATLDFELSQTNLIFLILNIHFYNRDIPNQDIVGIVLSHGYSTASSIADAVNSLLGNQIIQGIDMPLDTNVDEISEKINRFITLNPFYKNIILMVDMGSLEDIGLKIKSTVNIGVINNISTGLALSIGSKILQCLELEQILKSSCEESQCRYKILTPAQKERAIVFTNDAGIKISERLARLFKNSLPKTIDLKFLEYEYQNLLMNRTQDVLFQKYDVILMVKPINLHMPKINSVSLEDIVSFKEIERVNRALSQDLTNEEIEMFNQALLKNFSLQSVMENLTILNASKLLDYVSDAIHNLQKLMDRKFQSKTIVGIYIHICFLVERLVTKTAIETYEGMETFIVEQKEFVKHINESFEMLLNHYNVKIPISEIAYLYDYISNDTQKGDMTEDEL